MDVSSYYLCFLYNQKPISNPFWKLMLDLPLQFVGLKYFEGNEALYIIKIVVL